MSQVKWLSLNPGTINILHYIYDIKSSFVEIDIELLWSLKADKAANTGF